VEDKSFKQGHADTAWCLRRQVLAWLVCLLGSVASGLAARFLCRGMGR